MRKLVAEYMILEGPSGNIFITTFGNDLSCRNSETGEISQYKLRGLAECWNDARRQLDEILARRYGGCRIII